MSNKMSFFISAVYKMYTSVNFNLSFKTVENFFTDVFEIIISLV
jgi:hypothetical protein